MRKLIGWQGRSNLGLRSAVPLLLCALSAISTGCVGGSDGESNFDKSKAMAADAAAVLAPPREPVTEADDSGTATETAEPEVTEPHGDERAATELSDEGREPTSPSEATDVGSGPAEGDTEVDSGDVATVPAEEVASSDELDAALPPTETNEPSLSDAGSEPVDFAQDGGSELDAALVTGCNDRPSAVVPCGDDKGDKDADGDGIPNCEDPDIDGDEFPNVRDCAPFYALASLSICDGSDSAEKDSDKDEIRNCEDPDIDGDGFPNAFDGNPYKDPNAVSGK